MATCPTCRRRYGDDVSVCPDDGGSLLPDEAFAAANQDLEAGTTVGEYVIEKKIGSGSYGEVYAAEHPVIGKRAAIKVLHKKFSSQPEVVSRFIQEARAVNKIRHRNIIDIFSFGQLDDERQYLIMELLAGETLEEVLETRGPLSVADAYPILKGVADALDAAHAEDVAHRDLKPENIFVATERDGVIIPKLLDFGIAKLIGDESTNHKTATGQAMGTPLYMAPEQCRGKKVDHRADLYAFGVVIYETLTGMVPFTGDSAIDVLYKHITEEPLNLSEVASHLPPSLDAPVLHLLAKQPKMRPTSAGEALNALIDAAADAGMDVIPPSTRPSSTDFKAAAILRQTGGDADKRHVSTADTVAVSTLPSMAPASGITQPAAGTRPATTAATLDAVSSPTLAGSGSPNWKLIAAGVAAAVLVFGGGLWVMQTPSAQVPATSAEAPASSPTADVAPPAPAPVDTAEPTPPVPEPSVTASAIAAAPTITPPKPRFVPRPIPKPTAQPKPKPKLDFLDDR